MTTKALLADLQSRGVQFRVVDGEVRYHPPSALDDTVREYLSNHRGELLALLPAPAASRREVQGHAQYTQYPQNLPFGPSARGEMADVTLGTVDALPVSSHVSDSHADAAVRLSELSDPRGDDLVDDSDAWTRLLHMALDRGPSHVDTFWDLWGMRAAGLRLVRSDGRWILRPLVGSGGWESRRDYREDRLKYLLPHGQRIRELLERLGGGDA